MAAAAGLVQQAVMDSDSVTGCTVRRSRKSWPAATCDNLGPHDSSPHRPSSTANQHPHPAHMCQVLHTHPTHAPVERDGACTVQRPRLQGVLPPSGLACSRSGARGPTAGHALRRGQHTHGLRGAVLQVGQGGGNGPWQAGGSGRGACRGGCCCCGRRCGGQLAGDEGSDGRHGGVVKPGEWGGWAGAVGRLLAVPARCVLPRPSKARST